MSTDDKQYPQWHTDKRYLIQSLYVENIISTVHFLHFMKIYTQTYQIIINYLSTDRSHSTVHLMTFNLNKLQIPYLLGDRIKTNAEERLEFQKMVLYNISSGWKKTLWFTAK